MAIYVPNAKGYFPDVEPFTPDYKFLSDILDKRADKYESNYKALNNVYSQIVYSNLGREDTNEARSQFVNQLQPTIEKISGLDLSLAQNVNSAKAVFQPFYDNDLIVADMVQTKNINDIRKRANSYRTSSKQEVRDKYYDQGLQFAEFQYQDFLNASQEDALREPMARYIENPQLFKRAKAYLDKMGYKIKLPPKFTNDGAYQIITTNGEDVTSRFLAEIRELFGNDPLVQDAYFADAYVQARTYAENGMQSGMFSNVTEGMMDWNKGIIESSRDKIALQYSNLEKEINELSNRKKKYDSYLKDHAFVPGSPDDIKYKNITNAIDGKTAQLEQLNTTINEATTLLNSNDPQMINNRGFNILFQSNIEHDLFKAADYYSFVTKEVEMKVDDLYKEKYKSELAFKLEGYKSKLRKNEERLKSKLRREEKILENKLESPDMSYWQDMMNTTLDTQILGLDDYGKPTTDPSKVNFLVTQDKKILELGKDNEIKTANAIIEITKSLNEDIDNPLAILGDNFTASKSGASFANMSDEQIKEALLSPENVKKLYPYLESLKEQLNKDINNEKNLQLKTMWLETFDQLEQYNNVIESYEKVKAENFDQAEKSIPELKKMLEKGIPSILQKDENNNPMMIIDNFEDYEKLLLEDPDYVPKRTKWHFNQELPEEIINQINNGIIPDNLFKTIKVKKNGKLVDKQVFNREIFVGEIPEFSVTRMFAEDDYDQDTRFALMKAAAMAKEAGLVQYDDYNDLTYFNLDNSEIKEDFDKQIEILENTFKVTGDGDNGLYNKFDVNATLEGYETSGDLITETGKTYQLRSFGEKEPASSKDKLMQQYDALNDAIYNPSAMFESDELGEETPEVIRNIYRDAMAKILESQGKKQVDIVANVEYYPNMVRDAESGNRAGYVIRFSKMVDPTSQQNYSFSQREFRVTIPTEQDSNPYKTEQFENFYVGGKLKSSPNKKFTYDLGDYGKIDVNLNQSQIVEYYLHYPTYNAKTGVLELNKSSVRKIPYGDIAANDKYYRDLRTTLDQIIKTQLSIKEQTESELAKKNKSNTN